ncbi:MAG: cysteine desulfurase family protein [Planctomycetota bacterium]|jgi:cysteine desulfurase
MRQIYLDNNATTRPADVVVAAMADAVAVHWHNPSSVHRPGQAARQHVELARESVCQLLGCQPREFVFTGSGTEAANLAIRGALAARPGRPVLVTDRLEHSAVRELAEALETQGTEVVWLPVDAQGVIDIAALVDVLQRRADDIGLVSIMWANNETGTVQPVERLAARCREHGVWFHTDATQWVGKNPTDVRSFPVDLLSLAGHKFHGPKGIGGLFIRRGVRLARQIIGGPQERHRRGGTENVPGIVGLGAAAQLALEWLATDERSRLAALRDSFEARLCASVGDAVINGGGGPRIWNTTNIGFPRLEAEAILLLLSERGVCASAGAACSSGSLDPSPVLLAMGIAPAIAHGSVRFSISRETTDVEIDQALEIIPAVIDRLRSSLTPA